MYKKFWNLVEWANIQSIPKLILFKTQAISMWEEITVQMILILTERLKRKSMLRQTSSTRASPRKKQPKCAIIFKEKPPFKSSNALQLWLQFKLNCIILIFNAVISQRTLLWPLPLVQKTSQFLLLTALLMRLSVSKSKCH